MRGTPRRTSRANGAIYAIRRDAFVPIPGNTIIDDFVIPLASKLRHNGRIVYDCEAVATEETPPTITSEFRRRVRIGTGAYQSLAILWKLVSPRYGWTAMAFLSHKLLRWLVPFFLLAALASNLLLVRPSLLSMRSAGADCRVRRFPGRRISSRPWSAEQTVPRDDHAGEHESRSITRLLPLPEP